MFYFTIYWKQSSQLTMSYFSDGWVETTNQIHRLSIDYPHTNHRLTIYGSTPTQIAITHHNSHGQPQNCYGPPRRPANRPRFATLFGQSFTTLPKGARRTKGPQGWRLSAPKMYSYGHYKIIHYNPVI